MGNRAGSTPAPGTKTSSKEEVFFGFRQFLFKLILPFHYFLKPFFKLSNRFNWYCLNALLF
ncbi:hypothetical protein B0A62_19110 [Flavobacterium hydatis]|uniref:Uncharacterized protein n=1 Tax=Flavobacterium hydatis TaxID=991 RepID=A0ABX4CCG7_FLAHY|nr:hypothetical protein B0A62_19110 [Flavobacterium hydatis]